MINTLRSIGISIRTYELQRFPDVNHEDKRVTSVPGPEAGRERPERGEAAGRSRRGPSIAHRSWTHSQYISHLISNKNYISIIKCGSVGYNINTCWEIISQITVIVRGEHCAGAASTGGQFTIQSWHSLISRSLRVCICWDSQQFRG